MIRKPVSKAVAMLTLCGIAAVCSAATMPGIPQVLAPGELSGPASEDCLSFTPDGNTAVYDLSNGSSSTIVVSHKVNGAWSRPELASFSGQWMDHDPAISPDGTFIVFASNRPATPGGAKGGGLWRVDRKGEGWGEPVRLPDSVNVSPRIYAPSITADGSIYFIHPDTDNIQHVFRSQYRDGAYQPGVRQMLGDASTHQKDPGIAPDESFMVFDSDAGGKKDVDRFFIAFREGDHWSKAVDLGDGVNADNNPWGAHVSADGRTLYYTSDRSVKVAYPRSQEQARDDLARLTSWDDGESNIWSLSLTSWIQDHAAKKD